MSTLQLSDGTAMPAIGLGTWRSQPNEVYRAVRLAIEAGYRHIDCAWIYGNEAEIGQALKDAFRAGDVTREALWVTSKLWNDRHLPADVQPGIEASLEALGLEQLDLYLIHWPIAHRPGVKLPKKGEEQLSLDEAPLEKTWEAMVALREAGLTRQVGVSNFSTAATRLVRDAVGVCPAVNQVELHPYLQQQALFDAATEDGVVLTAYSPLGSGVSAEKGRPVMQDPEVVAIAEAHGATPAQVLIAWAAQRGTSVIPKSANPERIKQNLAAGDLSLTAEEMTRIAALDAGSRYIDGGFWCLDGGPYDIETLWG